MSTIFIRLVIQSASQYGSEDSAPGLHIRNIDVHDLIDAVETASTKGFEEIFIYDDKVSTNLLAAAIDTYFETPEEVIIDGNTLMIRWVA